MPVITLSSSKGMPVLGLGTAENLTKGSEREAGDFEGDRGGLQTL